MGATDAGIWRRLIVIPFEAKIEGNSDIKNYADYLYKQAGGVILTWIMEGARLIHAENYHLTVPRARGGRIECVSRREQLVCPVP